MTLNTVYCPLDAFRGALFDTEQRCFVTFESDPLSIPIRVPGVPPQTPAVPPSFSGNPMDLMNLSNQPPPIVPPIDYFYNIFYSPLTAEGKYS